MKKEVRNRHIMEDALGLTPFATIAKRRGLTRERVRTILHARLSYEDHYFILATRRWLTKENRKSNYVPRYLLSEAQLMARRKYAREYARKHYSNSAVREATRRKWREYYHKKMADPIAHAEYLERQKEYVNNRYRIDPVFRQQKHLRNRKYLKRRYHTDPVFRAKCLERSKEYFQRRKQMAQDREFFQGGKQNVYV